MFIQKYRTHLIVLAGFAIAFIIISYFANERDKSLSEHYQITTGVIYKAEIHKGVCLLFYTFNVGGKRINYNTQLFIDNLSLSELREMFVGKNSFVVAYDVSNLNNSKLLLSMKEYEIFKVKPSEYVIQVFNKIDSYRIK